MNYNIQRVDKLYDDLFDIVKVGDMNYHRLQDDDRLHPIYMDEKGYIGNKKWKQTHEEMKVKVSVDPSLDIILRGETLVINDVDNDVRSSPAFPVFKIRSLVIYPLFNNLETKEVVVGFICIPSVNVIKTFTEEEIAACDKLVTEFNVDIIKEEKLS